MRGINNRKFSLCEHSFYLIRFFPLLKLCLLFTGEVYSLYFYDMMHDDLVLSTETFQQL